MHVMLPFTATSGDFSTPVLVCSSGDSMVVPDGVSLPDGAYTLMGTGPEGDDPTSTGSFQVEHGDVVPNSVKLNQSTPPTGQDIFVQVQFVDLSALFGAPVTRQPTYAERYAKSQHMLQLCLDVLDGKLVIGENGFVPGYEQHGKVTLSSARRYFLEKTTELYFHGDTYAITGLLEAPEEVLNHLGYANKAELQAQFNRLRDFLAQRYVFLAEVAAEAEAAAKASAKPADVNPEAGADSPAP